MNSSSSKNISPCSLHVDVKQTRLITVRPSIIQIDTDSSLPPTPINKSNKNASSIKEKPEKSVKIRKKKIVPKTYLERIPIVGLYNFLHADPKWEKRFWAVTLTAASATTLFYLIPGIINFLNFSTVIEVQHQTESKLPFPNVYACLTAGYNNTYFASRLRKVEAKFIIDPRFIRLAQNFKTTTQNLYWEMVQYMSHLPNFQSFFNTALVPVYNEIIYRSILAMGSDWTGYGAFYEEGMFKCDAFLNKCALNGVEFPCCPKDRKTTFSAASMACFQINVTEAFSNESSKSITGGSYQLTFQTTADSRQIYTPYFDFVGLLVHFGNHLFTLFDDITHLPGGTTIYMSVETKRRLLYDNCTNGLAFNAKLHDRLDPVLQEFFKEMEIPQKYSIEKCLLANMFEEIAIKCGCVVYYGTINPYDTIICTPAHLYVCLNRDLEDKNEVPTITTAATAASSAAANNAQQGAMQELKTKANRCLPSCDTWSYDPRITFAPLAGERGNSSTIVSNQVIITMDRQYKHERDVLKIDLISFFATIGDGLSLFLGFSLITFIQVIVWGSAASMLAWKNRVASPFAANRVVK